MSLTLLCQTRVTLAYCVIPVYALSFLEHKNFYIILLSNIFTLRVTNDDHSSNASCTLK
jgi:hypothetical protein